MMNEIEVIECPICMDQIDEKKNKVTTECGHCFHTSCLMKNVAHNGYGCPYCRTVMAEEPEDNNSDEEYDEFSLEEEQGPDYNANVLRGSRWLFQRAEGEELDDDVDSESDDEEDEDRVEVEPRAPVDYIVEKLVQRGVTMADMVKSILIRDHDEYQFHDEFERADDDLFGKFRIIISNFQPPAPAPAIQAVEPEPEQQRQGRESTGQMQYDHQGFDQPPDCECSERPLEDHGGEQHDGIDDAHGPFAAVRDGDRGDQHDAETERGRGVAVDHLAPGFAGVVVPTG